MNVRWLCPECGYWTQTDHVKAAAWNCAHCKFAVNAVAPSQGEALTDCRCCGNKELYVQKAFPHWLGMGILVLACVASAVTYGFYWITWTWTILIGSAVVDGVLYLLMGNVTVCYRCRAQYVGFPANPEHAPFNLAIGERYRQEKLRREELKG